MKIDTSHGGRGFVFQFAAGFANSPVFGDLFAARSLDSESIGQMSNFAINAISRLQEIYGDRE